MTETQVKTAKNSILGCFSTKKVKIACEKKRFGVLMAFTSGKIKSLNKLQDMTITGRNC